MWMTRVLTHATYSADDDCDATLNLKHNTKQEKDQGQEEEV